MSNDRTERRTETARQNDDTKIIEEAAEMPTPDKVGRAGGNLQRDVGTDAAERKVRNPEAHANLTKEQELRHGTSPAAKANKGTS